ncbi:MAG: CRISPR-associated ring nuclease Crn3/Csx3 [Limnospira sp. PMC 1291.21]|uniref:CRISPR-associated protein, Csx3 family n=2 Tax=Limnospira TaxID=2596745 RepID=A0A9P1KJ85_9CYAN|nr:MULTISPECIES: CRISPR-associated ring nuclease Crn3/Csx3 [Limnospira]EKD07847.1 CRISPR-associated protein Csx3 family [Arthrospira platensis C1]MDC0838519.1 CRISPR-associated ring nuclease Crn3/Csx3 [Limnoraphis robusta]MDY7053918.1 CRISPR-associated ring nuclease Crn3/Csx3 [Limnospira fusiformis LS22]QJB25536.1 CRISPR-associated protein Csx3 [Limnospira fusiformis SAG 85.79]EDZ96322.1 CRISPR-associated protein, Csx3 family [Limnospira maxima CS-328]
MPQSAEPAIKLTLSQSRSVQGLSYQILSIELVTKDRLISPEDLRDQNLPAHIDYKGGIVISGRGPIWLYGYLIHELHPAAWVACYDPRLGAVVVATHSRQTQVGQVLSIDVQENLPPRLCPAMMIVGPPDSGKSVLSHALFRTLLTEYSDIYLQRAHWDGEGNWILELGEMTKSSDREAYKLAYKGGITDNFFQHHSQAILNLRRQKTLVVVDVGGQVQTEKVPLLEACTHYLIISSKPEEIAPWHEFCRDRGNLKCLTVLHSSLEIEEVIHKREPWLEMTWGVLEQGGICQIPTVLLEQVKTLLNKPQ